MNCELGMIERHSSGIQSSYRVLASTWMLAAFAGIGFVISKEFSFGIPKELLVAVIALGGGFGLVLLWVLDLMFYQRLLDAAYFEARNLEDTHPWLPQPRNNMRALLGGKGLQIVIWYYIALIEVMILIAGIGFGLLALTAGAALYVTVAFACAVLMILSPILIMWITSITPKLETKIREERNKRRLPRALSS